MGFDDDLLMISQLQFWGGGVDWKCFGLRDDECVSEVRVM